MIPHNPIAQLSTHEVSNMPPHMGDQDLWQSDIVLQQAIKREGAGWAGEHLATFGQLVGADDTFNKANQANRYPPELHAFDRYGMRINQVKFHPAYHDLMRLAIENGVASYAWNNLGQGAHVAHAALIYMFHQAEGGVMCPMAMAYSAIPALRTTATVADEWIPRLLSTQYDPRDIPVEQKTGALMGMFMTEKQGGSDVRTNTTRATPVSATATGIGHEYRLRGHKFFCSAPMCDAFLTLAYSDGGLSCFLVPRWTPDGERNGLHLQRIKDKLGNRSNASTEMELEDAWGLMVGEEGRGVRTIIDMVQHNRIYCANSSAGAMRQALIQALHHTQHRQAFGKALIDQPLMQNVLADLALEAEAAISLSLRISRAMDNAESDENEAALARIGTAIAKYWICKRTPGYVVEALECHGGSGYIEESILPRLYREAPLNSIWEGSGNVMCLDVLRAMHRERAAIPAIIAELELAQGGNTALDRAIKILKDELANPENLEYRARELTEQLALTLQGSLLIRHAPDYVADAFCASRFEKTYRGAYGTLTSGCDVEAIIQRSL